ncbi:MAG TPA: radical SAM family heme chaperone HemW, partial [Chloroflexota bacterium]|nr:radical SAM family heme chaperone HemW [Chloroflexota bacterium]
MDQDLALYVHIPFCEYKCTFCDFATYTGQERRADAYVEALLREIDLRAPHTVGGRSPSVFFGGGTPSLLPAAEIRRILAALDHAFALAPDAEITLESNPDTLPPAHLRALRDAGVTRLSIGVQSLNDGLLRSLNRLHTGAQALQALDAARHAGFSSVSADLIYGLPGQDRRDWEGTLQGLLAAEPDHLSIYGLIVEPGTRLRHQLVRGLPRLPDEDEAAEMYEYARDALGAHGYV